MQVVRIITNQDCSELIANLSKSNHGITVVDAHGAKGPVKMIFTIVKRKDLDEVASLIQTFNPSAFFSVEDVRDASMGVFRKGEKNSFMRGIMPGK